MLISELFYGDELSLALVTERNSKGLPLLESAEIVTRGSNPARSTIENVIACGFESFFLEA